jgi:hypothetical protein
MRPGGLLRPLRKFCGRLSSGKRDCYATHAVLLAQDMSHQDDLREYRVIDQQRLRDDEYRWEVAAALLHDHGDAIMQFCVVQLREGLEEEAT